MKLFAGSYTHKVDAKGRVSLPSAFRTTLRDLGSDHAVVVPNYFGPDYHVGLSQAGLESAVATVERRDDIDDATRHGMISALVAEAHLLAPDDAGRIVLPRELRNAIGVKGEVLFRGMASHFELWHPDAFAKRGTGGAAPKASLWGLHP